MKESAPIMTVLQQVLQGKYVYIEHDPTGRHLLRTDGCGRCQAITLAAILYPLPETIKEQGVLFPDPGYTPWRTPEEICQRVTEVIVLECWGDFEHAKTAIRIAEKHRLRIQKVSP